MELNVTFTGEALAALITEGALMVTIPVVLALVWLIKTKEKAIPLIIGAAIWFGFAIVLKLAPAYFLLQHDNPLAHAISGSVWLTALTAGLLAGVFEETGRFIAFKFILKKYGSRRTALTYGIGHVGFESLYVGVQILSLAVLGILLNSGLGGLINVGSEETAALLAQQLAPYANARMGEALWAIFERFSAIALHISLSVFVFAAVREKRFALLFPAAIFLHALFDFLIGFYNAGLVPVWGMELILAAAAAGTAVLASRVYKNLGRDNNEVLS